MMMVFNLLNCDEYPCFVVLRLGNTIYYNFLMDLGEKFGCSHIVIFLDFFPESPRNNVHIHIIKKQRGRESAKI